MKLGPNWISYQHGDIKELKYGIFLCTPLITKTSFTQDMRRNAT